MTHDFLCQVNDALMASKPKDFDVSRPECRQWFKDTGRMSDAFTAWIEGKKSRAIRIAESLADRYIH